MKLFYNNRDLTTQTGLIRIKQIMHDPEMQQDLPTITLLHEGLGCIGMWHDFPEAIALATGLDVLIFDRFGHGNSTMLTSGKIDHDYIDRESFDHLPEILDLCHINTTILFGHSDGGTIALLYASKHPDRVPGIISESAHTFVDDLTTSGIKNAATAFQTSDLRDKFYKYHGKNTDFLFWRWANTWLSEQHAPWNIEKHLTKITCPVLVIQGTDDQYGSKKQPDSIFQNTSGYSEKLMIPKCRHVPHHEKRHLVIEAVSKFIICEVLPEQCVVVN